MSENRKKLVQFLVGPNKRVSEATVSTSVLIKSGGEEKQAIKTESANLQVLTEGEPTKLWIEYGVTKNLGNFESAKISIGLSIPVGAEKDPSFASAVLETKSRASAMLESLVGKELDALSKIISQRGSSSPF